MDVAKVREDFPILGRSFQGRPLIYLDSAATSQKPRSVIDAECRFYEQSNANVHRGVYALAEEATSAYEGARERLARFVHASDPSEIVFLRGTTEAINLVASGLGETRLKRGDRVVTTLSEHHSNIVPWQLLKERRGTRLDFLGLDADGRLRVDELPALLEAPTKVVTVAYVSNVLGSVAPVREIADLAHDAGALLVVDAAQSAPHRPIDVRALGADFVAFSGHKMLGPTGIGVLWGRKDRLEELPPYMGGGEMIQEVHVDRVAFREPPARFEAGTPNVAGAVGLAAAADYLERLGWEAIAEHGQAMTRFLLRQAEGRFGDRIRFYGPPAGPDREPLLSFSFRGAHPHDVASLLDAQGIAVRAGHHCAQPLMEHLGVPALTRASPYVYNTEEELGALVDGLARVEQLFGDRTIPTARAG
jgi:cysteine desulfurase / selenocysteine lyase